MIANFDIERAARRYGAHEFELPGWDDEPFQCKLRRPALMAMARNGYVPNPLTPAVTALFSASKSIVDDVPIAEQAKALDAMARYALVEPTYNSLIEHGIELTDAQLTAIYMYAIGGVAAMQPFRSEPRGGAGDDEPNVQHAPVAADGDT